MATQRQGSFGRGQAHGRRSAAGQLRDLLNQAAALPPEQRAAFLDEACPGDPNLRARLDMLLATLDKAGAFLSNPTLADDIAVTALKLGATPPVVEGPGSHISHYKLLQQIGEGGMGVVFMADQQKPVRRRVALKIIKPGMDTRQVIARFEAERQALAMMDHPNIAKVLDAGATETTRPYFVMELVKGVPITAFCDENKLTTQQRLELFLPVCSALQHAHQKGIIHRDLKPSNVLVTMHDDKPVPKIIDFGVAKAIDQHLTEHTLFTEFRQMVGTPAYMSPEQAQMSGLNTDTRSDIYSLGVLLYELLTGTTPFDAKQLRSAAYDEMRRIIREVDPPKASTRLSTLTGAQQTALADQRRCDPATLSRTLEGDLDWILVRCLEKDRARRYESASALARDIQRHLSDEPVEASPPSLNYKFRKLARKHKHQAIAVCAVMAALVLGIIGTTIGLAQARRNFTAARQSARDMEVQKNLARANETKALQAQQSEQSQRRQAEAVAGMLESVFQQLDPYGPQLPNSDVKAQLLDKLNKIAGDSDKNPAGDPLVRARLLDSLGWTYAKLGEYSRAQSLLQSATSLWTSAGGPDDPQKYRTLFHLGVAYSNTDHNLDAIRSLEEARTWQSKNLSAGHRDTLETSRELAGAYQNAGRYFDGVRLYEQVRDQQTAMLGPDDPDTLKTQAAIAGVYLDAGRTTEAVTLLQEVISKQTSNPGANHPDTLRSRRSLGTAYGNAYRNSEAIALLTDVRDQQLKNLAVDHPDVLSTMNALATVYENSGRMPDAIKLLEQLWALRARKLGPEHSETDQTIGDLANAYESFGRAEGAVRMLERLRDERTKKLGPDAWPTLSSERKLSWAYFWSNRKSEGLRLIEQVRDKQTKLGPDNPHLLATLADLGNQYIDMNRIDDAVSILNQAIEADKRVFGPEHSKTLETMRLLAHAYIRAWWGSRNEGRGKDAIILLEQIQEITKRTGNNHGWAAPLVDLAEAYANAGRLDDAMRLLEVARDDTLKRTGEDDFYIIKALAETYFRADRVSEAFDAKERALRAVSRRWGPGGAETLSTAITLGDLYVQYGPRPEQIKRIEQARADALRAFHDGLAYDNGSVLGVTWSLVDVYVKVERFADALQLGEPLLADAIRTWGPECYLTDGFTADLIRIYRKIGRNGDASKLFQKLVNAKTKRLKGNPSDAGLFAERGYLYARMGYFQEAADDFNKAIELSPDNHRYWHDGLMPVLIRLGRIDEYRERLDRELQQFKDTTDELTAHRVAKDALVLPVDGQELKLGVELAERAMGIRSNSVWAWAGCETKGMAEYRTCHYQEAIKWMSECKKQVRIVLDQQAIADLFIAMSYQHLGNHASAMAALERAVTAIENEVPTEECTWGGGDYHFSQLIRREAEQLITGHTTPYPAPSTQPLASN